VSHAHIYALQQLPSPDEGDVWRSSPNAARIILMV